MRLKDYFSEKQIIRDAIIKNTYYTTSSLPQSVTFALDLKNIDLANNNPNVTAIITNNESSHLVSIDKGLVISKSPKKDFFLLHNFLIEKQVMELKYDWGIDKSAQIHETAIIGEEVFIGKNVIIDKNVIVENYSIIGDGTYIGPNAVIGARGMHNTFVDGELIYVEDAGGVKIGKGCEILANAIVQKNYFCNYTEIGDYNKISVNTSIAHATTIGNRNLIAGGSTISGYCSIGDNNWIGPSTVIAHNIKIGNGSSIKIGSVVVSNVEDGKEISGNFAVKHKSTLRMFVKNQ
ncbi:hypothetical protein [Maribellus mangrovi]|uniref:hypothetical protein n=1 Tax=Maribellus mangrovi TaxID=3133146 RepID=UPI0030EE8334